MIVFRGDVSHQFKFQRRKRSRYGFPCLFFASDKKHAQIYAAHYAAAAGKSEGGAVYQFEITAPIIEHDFKGKLANSVDFRLLIIAAFKSGAAAIKINNVVDVPHPKFKNTLFDSSIIVLFNFDHIKDYRLHQKHVRFG